MNPPETNFRPGWPFVLYDRNDHMFVRLRDGSPGNSALYARVNRDDGMIERSVQYTPSLGGQEDRLAWRVSMRSRQWMSEIDCRNDGVPPIVMPSEPVDDPRENPTNSTVCADTVMPETSY